MKLKKQAAVLIFGLLSLSLTGTGEENGNLFTLQTKASQGDVEAQVLLGNYFYFGDGVPKNEKEAVKWFCMAASKNDPEAQCMMGLCCYFGTGVSKNTQQAIKWWQKAAAQNDADAKFALSRLGVSSR
ncbi:MAG: tetratricopeptide repeat protein [Kiritimatiellales bacterium]